MKPVKVTDLHRILRKHRIIMNLNTVKKVLRQAGVKLTPNVPGSQSAPLFVDWYDIPAFWRKAMDKHDLEVLGIK